MFVTTTKETPLLQHPAHSAAAGYVGRDSLGCPLPRPAATRDPRPIALRASAPPPTMQRTTTCAPRRHGVHVGKCQHPGAPARDGGGERR